MTGFPRRLAGVIGPTADEERAAESVLGRDHRLTRAVSLARTLGIQLLVVALTVAVALLGVLEHVQLAPVVLGVAGAVLLALVLARLAVRGVLRSGTHEMLARGLTTPALRVVTRERRRLASQKERERLARSLERSLEDAQRWYRIPPPWRPLDGVQFLRESASEARDVVARLRAGRARVQGVALTARLLEDGCRSPLYAGDPGLLREELRRIRYLLEPGSDDAAERIEARKAA